MKQIDKIAREIKATLVGENHNYYHSLTIYIDNNKNELYVQFWGQGESWITKPDHLTEIASFNASYGDWCRFYGNSKNWLITKQMIALVIRDYLKCGYIDKLPSWLDEEINSILSKDVPERVVNAFFDFCR